MCRQSEYEARRTREWRCRTSSLLPSHQCATGQPGTAGHYRDGVIECVLASTLSTPSNSLRPSSLITGWLAADPAALAPSLLSAGRLTGDCKYKLTVPLTAAVPRRGGLSARRRSPAAGLPELAHDCGFVGYTWRWTAGSRLVRAELAHYRDAGRWSWLVARVIGRRSCGFTQAGRRSRSL